MSTSPLAPALDDGRGEVGQRGVVGRQLHRERDAERGADGLDHGEVLGLDLGGAAPWVRRHAVEVELQRVRAGLFDEPRIAHPATRRGRVEAGDHRDVQRSFISPTTDR